MKHTNLIALLLAIILCASLFSACGGEKDDETQPAPTLPTVDAPVATGGTTAPEQGSKPVSTDDPFGETKDWMPGEQPTETPGEDPTFAPFTEARPGETQPSSEQPKPTDPKPSEAVPGSDDSDEDIPVTSTAYLDDTDEDLP